MLQYDFRSGLACDLCNNHAAWHDPKFGRRLCTDHVIPHIQKVNGYHNRMLEPKDWHVIPHPESQLCTASNDPKLVAVGVLVHPHNPDIYCRQHANYEYRIPGVQDGSMRSRGALPIADALWLTGTLCDRHFEGMLEARKAGHSPNTAAVLAVRELLEVVKGV